ncbi:type II toxin-antitoxin system RelE/ParE family toxin [Candidatus Daviesbacteria bacterium]|nr:type II toxin-antitoxin system RelE/ParE family toxin [Candidatus Daviesbacteria bacterium]
MYQITFSKKALKSLKKIPIDYQVKIKKASDRLSLSPFDLDLRKLSSYYQATHRLRVGDYRIFLRIDFEIKIIEIVEIERRTTQTYH